MGNRDLLLIAAMNSYIIQANKIVTWLGQHATCHYVLANTHDFDTFRILKSCIKHSLKARNSASDLICASYE